MTGEGIIVLVFGFILPLLIILGILTDIFWFGRFDKDDD